MTQLPPAEVEKTDKELQDKTISAPAKVVIGATGKADGQLVAPKGLAVANSASPPLAGVWQTRCITSTGRGMNSAVTW